MPSDLASVTLEAGGRWTSLYPQDRDFQPRIICPAAHSSGTGMGSSAHARLSLPRQAAGSVFQQTGQSGRREGRAGLQNRGVLAKDGSGLGKMTPRCGSHRCRGGAVRWPRRRSLRRSWTDEERGRQLLAALGVIC